MARPSHEPTDANRQLVKLHATVGATQEDIARLLGIDPKTLRLHYRDELDLALLQANAVIGGALFNKAKSGDTPAIIFWMKTRGGWKETHKIEGAGPGGEHIHRVQAETRDELIERARRLGIDPAALGLAGGGEEAD